MKKQGIEPGAWVTITKKPNNKYRITDGAFILYDNVDDRDLFNKIEKISQETSGHPELDFNIITIEVARA